MQAIGLMSGTSLDGVDAAWIETDGECIDHLGPAVTLPYDSRLRADLRRLLERAPGLASADSFFLDVEARLTARHADAVSSLGTRADILGFHGQTILHRPGQRRTWQIGDAAALARTTGVPVVSDFRSADVAAGGQGAPLASLYHAILTARLERPLAVLNVGGVANVTFMGADGALLACDTGPGNGPIDDWAERHAGASCDHDGRLALAGLADATVLKRLVAHPYFGMKAPKSLDRLDFSNWIEESGLHSLSARDGAATLVAFLAEAVARTELPAAPRRWLVTGGGRHNPAIMGALLARLAGYVEPVETHGFDGDSLEAQCFGLLAVRVTRGLPTTFPGTTGVPVPTVGGRITTAVA